MNWMGQLKKINSLQFKKRTRAISVHNEWLDELDSSRYKITEKGRIGWLTASDNIGYYGLQQLLKILKVNRAKFIDLMW